MAQSPTVSAEWLKERLGQPGIKLLDGSWYMPVHARDRIAEFKARRIPGARYFDIDGIADTSSGLPHMVPSEAAFSAALDALGITPSDTVVVYDGLGMFSAPRVWWTFKIFGHQSVYVLEGGLPAWQALGGPVDESPVDEAQFLEPVVRAKQATAPGAYPARLDTSKVRSFDQVLALANTAGQQPAEQIVDARSAGRFVGTEPEPRAGLRGGHIPGARNVPFPTVLKAGGRLKSAPELAATFTAAGVDLGKPLIASCGSGLSACILALAAYKATDGKALLPVYDGSWLEWGARADTPVSTEAPQ